MSRRPYDWPSLCCLRGTFFLRSVSTLVFWHGFCSLIYWNCIIYDLCLQGGRSWGLIRRSYVRWCDDRKSVLKSSEWKPVGLVGSLLWIPRIVTSKGLDSGDFSGILLRVSVVWDRYGSLVSHKNLIVTYLSLVLMIYNLLAEVLPSVSSFVCFSLNSLRIRTCPSWGFI